MTPGLRAGHVHGALRCESCENATVHARLILVTPLLAALCACPPAAPPPNAPEENWQSDLLRTDLAVDLSDPDALRATATLLLDNSGQPAASFDVRGLDIDAVVLPSPDLRWELEDGRLDVALPRDVGPVSVEVTYGFAVGERFEGFMDTGATLTWPYWCGNLFPCRPHPSDGARFGVTVSGAAEGLVTISTADSVTDAPAYQLAWATGPYVRTELGVSVGGTAIAHHAPAEDLQNANAGTADLVAIFSWLEQTLGPYPFGPEAGAVQVDWGAGAFGGMEHHPVWHVSRSAMGDATVHAHEAAHGWFGDGVRLRCWEDFVLSEGTATYLAARAQQVVVGATRGDAVWAGYDDELRLMTSVGLSNRDRVVWPAGCGDIDVLEDGLFGRIVYIKGAWFFRQVADAVGAEALDAALGAFTRDAVGSDALMAGLLDRIRTETGFDPEPLAQQWLRTEGVPAGWDDR